MSKSSQLKRAQHIISLHIDDLNDLIHDTPANDMLDKRIVELTEKSERLVALINKEIKKPQKPEQIENQLDQKAFNKVFS
ncbi:MAG: hypothetical protein KAT04_13005 [Methylococcales bacterium]|nr:hypothetical protein [Methylococcales bacterium]